MEPIVVVHGGTNSPVEWADGCQAAADAAYAVLRAGGSALDAAVAAVKVMEDDGRFNAGVGSFLRLDGETIETDAGVMDSAGRIGAVAALRGYRHPVDAARAVMDTPHVLLAGEGAGRLAALSTGAVRGEKHNGAHCQRLTSPERFALRPCLWPSFSLCCFSLCRPISRPRGTMAASSALSR